jgi:mycofactocin precursor
MVPRDVTPVTEGRAAMSDSHEPEVVADTVVTADEDLLEQDLLVEDVSIDGMCGVY